MHGAVLRTEAVEDPAQAVGSPQPGVHVALLDVVVHLEEVALAPAEGAEGTVVLGQRHRRHAVRHRLDGAGARQEAVQRAANGGELREVVAMI